MSYHFLSAVSLAVLILGASPRAASREPCPDEAPIIHLEAAGGAGGRLTGSIYSEQEIEVTARLRTTFTTIDGASGFSLSVAHDLDALDLIEVTNAGTDTGLLIRPPYFELTREVDNETGAGFISTIILSHTEQRFFPPTGDSSLARARYRPMVEYGARASRAFSTTIEPRDGLQNPVPGIPVQNSIIYRGSMLKPCLQPLAIDVIILPKPAFLRGDANFDGVLDISDPTAILETLFLGEGTIRCEDAADANDDSALDISDAIAAFGFLFLGDSPPPPPFPLPGDDPTPDSLGCRP